jgi:hypothetical protein
MADIEDPEPVERIVKHFVRRQSPATTFIAEVYNDERSLWSGECAQLR